MSNPPEIDAIWVISDVAPDGTYVVGIQAGPDVAVILNRDRAFRYAATAAAAGARATYDAAVFAQLIHLGISQHGAAQAVVDLRADRPPLDDDATAPLRFDPLVTARKKEPAVYVELKGQRIAQWTVPDVQGHAVHVLDVLAGVDLDAAYHRYLIGTIGLDDGRARAVVGDLGKQVNGGTDAAS